MGFWCGWFSFPSVCKSKRTNPFYSHHLQRTGHHLYFFSPPILLFCCFFLPHPQLWITECQKVLCAKTNYHLLFVGSKTEQVLWKQGNREQEMEDLDLERKAPVLMSIKHFSFLSLWIVCLVSTLLSLLNTYYARQCLLVERWMSLCEFKGLCRQAGRCQMHIRDSLVCPPGAEENHYLSLKKWDVAPLLTGPRNVESPE